MASQNPQRYVAPDPMSQDMEGPGKYRKQYRVLIVTTSGEDFECLGQPGIRISASTATRRQGKSYLHNGPFSRIVINVMSQKVYQGWDVHCTIAKFGKHFIFIQSAPGAALDGDFPLSQLPLELQSNIKEIDTDPIAPWRSMEEIGDVA